MRITRSQLRKLISEELSLVPEGVEELPACPSDWKSMSVDEKDDELLNWVLALDDREAINSRRLDDLEKAQAPTVAASDVP